MSADLVGRHEVGRVPTAGEGLVGRADDIAWILAFVDRMVHVGGSLLLSGPPGIGRSALLAAAARGARRWGVRVLTAEGAAFEADLPYSTLNQLLRPVLDKLDLVEPPLREALRAALGLRDGPAPAPLAVANAVIALLARVGGAAFVALVVDDAQWADAPSAVVLGMVARRTAATRIGLLMAARSDHPTLLSDAVTVERAVGPLTPAAARDLVRRAQPGLGHAVRERLLRESGGTPAALIELGALLAADPDAVLASGSTLPLPPRLRGLYADRLTRLPAPTRALLLAAALEPACDGSVLRAVAGDADAVVELTPAVRDGLVELGRAATVRFTQPLVRSTVVALAGLDERARSHRLLADAFADDPVRRAWHLGQATTGPDEDLAALLDAAAPALGDAAAALVRAADLTPTPAARARRLARAAWFAVTATGDAAVAARLLAAAHEADPAVDDAPVAVAVLPHLVLDGRGDVDAVHARLLRTYRDADPAAVRDVLRAHAVLAGGTTRRDLWDSHAAARPDADDALSATFARGAVAPRLALLPALDAAVAALAEDDDLARVTRVAAAAGQLDAMDACRPALERALARRAGDDADVAVVAALDVLGRHAVTRGDGAAADRVAADVHALAGTETLAGWGVDAWTGVLAARRGQAAEVSRACAALAERSLTPALRVVRVAHDLVRAEEALARAEWARAFALLRGVMPADDPFGELGEVPFRTLDLAEAAWHSGHVDEARAHVAAMAAAGCARLASRAAVVTAGARALVAAEDAEAAAAVADALAAADRWPFERARVQLAHGRRLRRGRDPRAARVALAAATEGFERLGATPWAAQAAAELKATGQGAVRQGRTSSALTAQEWAIAELAARGLTNKEIGTRLALSPRTVSTHLYRIFPKLGVTSRAGLRDAISELAPAPDEPA